MACVKGTCCTPTSAEQIGLCPQERGRKAVFGNATYKCNCSEASGLTNFYTHGARLWLVAILPEFAFAPRAWQPCDATCTAKLLPATNSALPMFWLHDIIPFPLHLRP